MKSQLTICLVFLGSSLLSQAAWGTGFDRQSRFVQQYAAAPAPRISADEAAARVQREYGGRILAVETRQRNGQTFYRIKVLTRKGVVRVVRVNAGSRR